MSVFGFTNNQIKNKACGTFTGSAKSAPLGTRVRTMAIAGFLATTLLAIFAHTPSAQAKSGYSSFVIDRNSGKTLHAKKADTLRYPASLTKMMTLYIVFDLIDKGHINYKTKLRVTKKAASQQPSKLGLKAGSKITVRTAIRALVTKSANDVAVTVAENLAGSERKFARIMTTKARQIGMKKTIFKNASGLPNRNQVTTARDMAILGERLLTDFPKKYKFFQTRSFAYKGRSYRNHNTLLRNYSGTDGIKTGYTRASGYNLVSSVRRGKKHLIGVVLGGKTARKRDASMRAILTRAFKTASKTRRRVARRANRQVPIPSQRVARLRGAKPKFAKPMIAKLSAPKRRPTQVAPSMRARHHPTNSRSTLQAPSNANRGLRPSIPVGAYHVQVGAYTSKQEAELKILEVSHRMGGQLTPYKALTMPYNLNNKKLYYRARFAGLATSDNAASLCNRIKAAKFDCIVMRAE